MSANGQQTGPMLPAGTLLLTEEPYVYCLSYKLRNTHCEHCLARFITPKWRCARCKYAHYCSVPCQHGSWPVHQRECRVMQSLAADERYVPDIARMLARMLHPLLTAAAKQQTLRFHYQKYGHRKLADLMSHFDELTADAQITGNVKILLPLIDSLLGPSASLDGGDRLPLVLRLFGQLRTNAMTIMDEYLNTLGTGIYVGASVLDHSCRPNAVVTFVGRTMQLRSIEAIPVQRTPAVGRRPTADDIDMADAVRICYVDMLDPRERRQQKLQQQYYFECACERCGDDDEDRRMQAAACPKAQCREPIDMRVPTTMCPRCSTPIDQERRDAYAKAASQTRVELKSARSLNDFDTCARLIDVVQRDVFHPENSLHLRTLETAMETAITSERWELALAYGRRYLRAERYLGRSHPALALTHMKMAKVLQYLERIDESTGHLEFARDAIWMTHEKDGLIDAQLLDMMREAEMKAD